MQPYRSKYHINTNFSSLSSLSFDKVDTYIAENRRVSVREALELLYTPEQIRRIDTAIPQPWANTVETYTGVYPPGLVVWSYNKEHGSELMGAPVPTCSEGLSLLWRLAD